MNEGIIVFLFIFGIMLFIKRRWLINYIKEYKVEMKKAWKGSKKPSHLEFMSINNDMIKRGVLMLVCLIISAELWFFIGWWALAVFFISYLTLGVFFMQMGWIK